MANQKQWWIYEGNGTENGVNKLKAIKEIKPPWREGYGSDHNAQSFIMLDQEVLDGVNAAIYLRRPLLVTGEPGIGKSTLAKQLAIKLTLKKLLKWDITSKSTLNDALYSYDALARLHDIQMKKLAYEIKELKEEDDFGEFKNLNIGIGSYLKLGAIGTAFIDEEPRVVLIDEIDKSDDDLPNDLLHIFEEQIFEIPHLKRLIHNETGKEHTIKDIDGNRHAITDGVVKCKGDFPIIVMTSNGEREFPPAFLRRCIQIHLRMPSDRDKKIENLTNMVKEHFKENQNDTIIKKVIESFVDYDDGKLRTNDQLLNALYLILKTPMNESEDVDFQKMFDTNVWYPVG